MKKLILLAFSLLLMLQVIGCQSSNNPYPEFLAKEEGKYFVLIIGPKNHPDTDNNELFNKALRKIKDELTYLAVIGETSLKHIVNLDDAQVRYPKLNIEKAPAVMVFDNKEMKLKTYDINEAVEYMQSIQR